MAISASAVWEIRTDGADTNGGGFVAGASGTDYSQQASAQLTVTDGACSASTTLTSATGGFTSAMTGNLVYLSSGPGWYEIKSYTDTNTVTVDRAGPTATGMTLNVGGALATPGIVTTLPLVSYNTIWLKSGTYTLTTATAGSGGPITKPNLHLGLRGYQTTRGDNTGTRPLVHAGAYSPTYMISMYASNFSIYVENVEVDCNSNATNGIHFHSNSRPAINCIVRNAVSWGFYGKAYRCSAFDCAGGFLSPTEYCIAVDCTTRGFYNGHHQHFIAIRCNYGVDVASPTYVISQGIFDGCTKGFYTNNEGRTTHIEKCVFINCVEAMGTQYSSQNFRSQSYVDCAFWNNTADRTTGSTFGREDNLIALTANPFTSATDYTPTTAGAAELATTGWQGETWVSHIGAVTPLAGGGGLLRVGMSGGING